MLKSLVLKPFVIMGVVNVTPDSFYDGGRYHKSGDAKHRVRELAEEGADVIDIGGESTRPGSRPVSKVEELDRIIPVIEYARKFSGVSVSVDTTKSSVAFQAVKSGADWINDISAGRFDSRMPEITAGLEVPVIIMHSRETPETMQNTPGYTDVVKEVKNELMERVELFKKAGIRDENIIIDPGIGFGKRVEDNLDLLKNLDRFSETRYPVLVGVSRKSFIGEITGRQARDRLAGTMGSICAAFIKGAKIFRVHDAAQTKDCLSTLSAIINR